MPSYLDIGLIGVILVSALLAMLRGFTREVLAIVSWGAAAAAAYFLYPLVMPRLEPYIAKESIRLAASIGAIFFVTLVVVSLITVRLSDVILDSRVGALDRSFGFLFGAARGLLLCAVAFIFFEWLVPEKTQPEWVRTARMRPLLAATGDEIKSVLPDDPDSLLAKLKKPRSTTADEPAADTDTAPAPPPRPAPGKRT